MERRNKMNPILISDGDPEVENNSSLGNGSVDNLPMEWLDSTHCPPQPTRIHGKYEGKLINFN